MIEKLTDFELDYITYKLGIYDVLKEDEIIYHDMKMKKVNNHSYKVIIEDTIIFTGKIKDCLDFMESNRMEFFKCIIPYCTKEFKSHNVKEYIIKYKEWLLK